MASHLAREVYRSMHAKTRLVRLGQRVNQAPKRIHALTSSRYIYIYIHTNIDTHAREACAVSTIVTEDESLHTYKLNAIRCCMELRAQSMPTRVSEVVPLRKKRSRHGRWLRPLHALCHVHSAQPRAVDNCVTSDVHPGH